MSQCDQDLHHFLVPSLTSITIHFEDILHQRVDIRALLGAASQLVNLRTCVFYYPSFRRGDEFNDPGNTGFLSVECFPTFLRNLPHPDKLVAFTSHLIKAPVELFSFMASLSSLSHLDLDTRSITDLQSLGADHYANPLSGLPSPHLLVSLRFFPFRNTVFNFQSLVPFHRLLDVTIRISRSGSIPINIAELRLLPYLQKVSLEIFSIGSILTTPVFTALIGAWPELQELNLVHPDTITCSVTPVTHLRLEILETVARQCPHLRRLMLTLDASSDHGFPTPPPSLCRPLNATFLLCGIVASTRPASRYLRTLYQLPGSCSVCRAGHLWS